jgi:ParB family chromosome partitioning protein
VPLDTTKIGKGQVEVGQEVEGTKHVTTSDNTPPSTRKRLRILQIPIKSIVQSSDVQTRKKVLDPQASDEDARFIKSIKKHGVLIPVKVKPLNDGSEFQMVAGHRRLAACGLLGLDSIPAIIADGSEDDNEQTLYTVIENAHRKDLSDHEKALLVKELADRGLTQRQIAEEMNCSQSLIFYYLNYLEIQDKRVLNLVEEEKIGARRAVEIMNVPEAARSIVVNAIGSGIPFSEAIKLASATDQKNKERKIISSDTKEGGDRGSDSATGAKQRKSQKPTPFTKKKDPNKDERLAKILPVEDQYINVAAYAKANPDVHVYALAAWVRTKGNFEDGLASYNDTPKTITRKVNSIIKTSTSLAVYLSYAQADITEAEVQRLIACVFDPIAEKD